VEYYELELCGLERRLPLIYVGKRTRLASFSILGDVELVNCLADTIAKKLKKVEFDYLVSPEVKVVPLTHGVALRLGHKHFIVCRKSIKPYMVSPAVVKPLSHFPKHAKPLVIDGVDTERVRGKKVVILDDIISSGVTMRMMSHLMKTVGAEVVSYFAVIKQGEQFDQLNHLEYLEEIPVFRE
jgi:adenine phosphoribosyltransferase